MRFGETSLVDFMSYNGPLADGLANAAAFLGLVAIATWIALNPLVIAVVYAVLVVPLLWLSSIEIWSRVVVALSLPTALMPVVYLYALNWVLAATTFTIWIVLTSTPAQTLRPLAERVPMLALAVGMAMLPVFIRGRTEADRSAGVVSLAPVALALGVPLAAWLSRSQEPTEGVKAVVASGSGA